MTSSAAQWTQRAREAAGPGPVTYTAAGQPDPLWWTVGLGLGLANAARHRLRGYRTPRPFPGDEVERSVDYVIGVVDRWCSDGELKLAGARVLEVGPGPDLGTGAVLLARGAASYTAADLFPLAMDTDDAFYAALARRLGQPVDRSRLTYHVTGYPEMRELDGPYDLVVSNAALEHFADVQATFTGFAELVPPGGVMCHHIDGMVHMRGVRSRDPLNMLRYPEAIYRLMGFPGVPNRLRASDYLAAAEATGWTARIVPCLVAPEGYVDRVRGGLSRAYRTRTNEDLALLTFTLVCTRRRG